MEIVATKQPIEIAWFKKEGPISSNASELQYNSFLLACELFKYKEVWWQIRWRHGKCSQDCKFKTCCPIAGSATKRSFKTAEIAWAALLLLGSLAASFAGDEYTPPWSSSAKLSSSIPCVREYVRVNCYHLVRRSIIARHSWYAKVYLEAESGIQIMWSEVSIKEQEHRGQKNHARKAWKIEQSMPPRW